MTGSALALACLAFAGAGPPLVDAVPVASATRSTPARPMPRSVQAVGLAHAPAPSPPAGSRPVVTRAAPPAPPPPTTRATTRPVSPPVTRPRSGTSVVPSTGSRTTGPAPAQHSAPVAGVPYPPRPTLGACTTGELTARVGPTAAASGHSRVTVVLTNTSTVPCTLDGFPAAQLFGAAGTGVPTVTVDGAAYTFPPFAPSLVTLAGSGGQAVVALETVDMPGTGSCQTGSSLELTLPGGAVIHLPLAVLACDGGRVHVSPVLAGGLLPAS